MSEFNPKAAQICAPRRPLRCTPRVGSFDHASAMHGARPHHCYAPSATLSHSLEGQRHSPLPHSLPRLSPLLSAPSPSLCSLPERTSAMDASTARCRYYTARLTLLLLRRCRCCSAVARHRCRCLHHRCCALMRRAPVGRSPRPASGHAVGSGGCTRRCRASPALHPLPTCLLRPMVTSYATSLTVIRDQGLRVRI
jgi:hypothetical protein